MLQTKKQKNPKLVRSYLNGANTLAKNRLNPEKMQQGKEPLN